MKKGFKVLLIISILMVIGSMVAYYFLKGLISTYIPSRDARLMILFGVESLFCIIIFFILGTANRRRDSKIPSEKIQRLEIVNKKIECLEKNVEYVGKDGSEIKIGLIKYGNVKNPVTFTNRYTEEEIFGERIIGKKLEIIAPALYNLIANDIDGSQTVRKTVKVKDKYYLAILDKKKRTIYLDDTNEKEVSSTIIRETKSAIMIISVDNIASLDKFAADQRAGITHKFYKMIHEWVEGLGFDDLYTLSDAGDKQVFLIKESGVQKIDNQYGKQKLFADAYKYAKEIDADITISIGIGKDSDNYEMLGFYAEQALAQGQSYGGNTIVIYDGKKMRDLEESNDTSYRPFVKTTTIEPTKNIINLIRKSSNILIVPPKKIDIDTFSSSMAMHEICACLGTPSWVIFAKENADRNVNKIYDTSTFEDVAFHESLIRPETARRFVKGKKLVIYIGHDTEEESLYGGFVRDLNARVIIDNIDTTTKNYTVEDKDFSFRTSSYKRINCNVARGDVHYNDASVSSVTQLVTEIASALPFEFHLKEFTATVMLSALESCTSGFKSGTDSGTFAAASYLMESGADSSEAKTFLRLDVEQSKRRTEFQTRADQIILGPNSITLVYTDQDRGAIRNIDDALMATKVLLEVEDAVSSFVIWKERGTKDMCFVTFDFTNNEMDALSVFSGMKSFNPNASSKRRNTFRFAIQGHSMEDVEKDLKDSLKEKEKKD